MSGGWMAPARPRGRRADEERELFRHALRRRRVTRYARRLLAWTAVVIAIYLLAVFA